MRVGCSCLPCDDVGNKPRSYRAWPAVPLTYRRIPVRCPAATAAGHRRRRASRRAVNAPSIDRATGVRGGAKGCWVPREVRIVGL